MCQVEDLLLVAVFFFLGEHLLQGWLCCLEENCRIYCLLKRMFGVLHHIPPVSGHIHSCSLLCSPAKTYSKSPALPDIT